MIERSVLTGASDSVATAAAGEQPQFAAGAEALAVVRAVSPPQRVWSDGADAAPLSRLSSIALAADSRRAAGIDANGDIWIVDPAANAAARLTFTGNSASPVWSADGARLVFASRDGAGIYRVVSRSASDRNETPARLASAPPHAFPTSVAADGRVAVTAYADGHTRVVVLTPDGRAARALTDGPFDEGAAVFSPDGRWLALESTASGRTDIIVRSATGGAQATCRRGAARIRDGATMGDRWYFERGRRVMRAAFAADPSPRIENPQVVRDLPGERVLAIAPSGRVLVERQPPSDTAVIVLQWLRELRERLPLPVNTPR